MARKRFVGSALSLAPALSMVLGNTAIALEAAGRHSASDTAPLTVEAKIPLGDVQGRIDHLAFDPTRGHLYVAELGNNTVGTVDLKTRRVIRTAGGFAEPQGLAYEPSTDTVYVEDFAAVGRIALGGDADNIRVDRTGRRIYVGYGDGALAVIDPTTRKRIAEIALKGHPESFQLDPTGTSIFVNVPDAGEIAVVGRDVRRQVASWPTDNLHANYPLALNSSKSEVITIFRRPPRLERFEMASGNKRAGIDVCADSDDVFVDPVRHRVYVICGEGFVDTFDASDEQYTRIGRLQTFGGSRTGLYVQELDRLLVAIRASVKEPAAVWILRPRP
jgi:YVTN family beta-propeller protein